MSATLSYWLILLAGILAGFINTLAGSGSLITLSMFMLAGLPANIANGSNRLGALLQSAVGFFTFYKSGQIELKKGLWFVYPVLGGALAGAFVASSLAAQTMEWIILGVMILMLFVILFKPQAWLRESSEKVNYKTFSNFVLFLIVGFYGGFVMAGVGILLLSVLVVSAKYSLKEANAIKLLTVFFFALPVFFIYVFNDQVDWFLAILAAVGQAIGAWIAARFATENKNAKIWTHRLLIIIVVFSILKTFSKLI